MIKLIKICLLGILNKACRSQGLSLFFFFFLFLKLENSLREIGVSLKKKKVRLFCVMC